MNRIDKTLKKCRDHHRKILSPYITAGDPDALMTVPLMHALVDAGADILEIGLPFSDPMAEGPVIQDAMERALAQGIHCEEVLAMVAEFRQHDQETPVILMGYLNPIEQYGYEAFAKQAHEVGVDGTIIVDLPPEERNILAAAWVSFNLYPIYLCSPTTADKRMQQLNDCSKGYVYFVSLTGVTGADSFDLQQVKQDYIAKKKAIEVPMLVGFGIKTPEIAAQVAEFADGIIIGSALVTTVFEAFKQKKDGIQAGAKFIQTMRKCIDEQSGCR